MDRMAILAKTQKRHEGKSERGGGCNNQISMCNRTTCCPICKWLDEKDSEDSQIGRSGRLSPILKSEEFFRPIICKLDKHVVLLLINYTVQINLQIILLRGAALTTRWRHLTMSLCSVLMCSCSLCDFSAVQVLLLEAQETFRFGYFGSCRWNSEKDLAIFGKTLAFSQNRLHSAMQLSCHVTPSCVRGRFLWSDCLITYFLKLD